MPEAVLLSIDARISVNPHSADRSRDPWVASACVFTEQGLESLHAYDPTTLRVITGEE